MAAAVVSYRNLSKHTLIMEFLTRIKGLQEAVLRHRIKVAELLIDRRNTHDPIERKALYIQISSKRFCIEHYSKKIEELFALAEVVV